MLFSTIVLRTFRWSFNTAITLDSGAFPARSPNPLTVVWMPCTPALTAAATLATARSFHHVAAKSVAVVRVQHPERVGNHKAPDRLSFQRIDHLVNVVGRKTHPVRPVFQIDVDRDAHFGRLRDGRFDIGEVLLRGSISTIPRCRRIPVLPHDPDTRVRQPTAQSCAPIRIRPPTPVPKRFQSGLRAVRRAAGGPY